MSELLLGEEAVKKTWWAGLNGYEYIAWEGAMEVAVYSPGEDLPIIFIKSNERILTHEDFHEALDHGIRYYADYEFKHGIPIE